MNKACLSFSLVIPTWNRASALSDLLASIVNQRYPGTKLEIIVVDSFSNDDTSNVIADFSVKNPGYQLRYLNVDTNTPSHKRNIGIKNASLDWLIFIDDDCVISDNYLQCCNDSISAINSSRAIFFGEVRYPTSLIKTSNYNKYRDSRHFVAAEKPQSTGFIKITTMNMFCNVYELRASGVFFDEDYKFSCEDTDFGYRLQWAEFNFFTSNATVYHYESCKDILTYLKKCKRVYFEGYSLVQKKDPILAKKMIWKYFTPIRWSFGGVLHSLFLRIIFNKKFAQLLAKFLFKTDSNKFLYSEKLFMYVIISAYIDGLDFK